MTQTGINLQRVQILETDICIPKPGVETFVTAAGGRRQDRANSKDNKTFFSYISYTNIVFLNVV